MESNASERSSSFFRDWPLLSWSGKRQLAAQPFLETSGLKLFTSCHPSPINRAASRAKWDAIPYEWAEVLGCIHTGL